MLAMILLQMHTTVRFHVYLGGNVFYVPAVTEIYYHMFVYSTHKILGCVTLSRKDHICAQTRELACTKLVLPQVMAKSIVCAVH